MVDGSIESRTTTNLAENRCRNPHERMVFVGHHEDRSGSFGEHGPLGSPCKRVERLGVEN